MISKTIQVLLVDDHVLFREGLRGILELEEKLKVVAEGGSAEEALQLLASHRVDVALIDLNLPDRDGVWLLRKIRSEYPKLPVLVVSMHDGSHEVLAAVTEGANGYLTKTVSREELLAAIQTVLNGGTHLSQAAARPVLQRLSQMEFATEAPELNDRERAVLKLVIAGKSNNEIAREISLSVSRIKFHLSDLFTKFSVSDRTSLAVEASKLGLSADD